MKPVAHIYAKEDGTFDIASSLPPADTVQLLLSLASAVVRMIPQGQSALVEVNGERVISVRGGDGAGASDEAAVQP